MPGSNARKLKFLLLLGSPWGVSTFGINDPLAIAQSLWKPDVIQSCENVPYSEDIYSSEFEWPVMQEGQCQDDLAFARCFIARRLSRFSSCSAVQPLCSLFPDALSNYCCQSMPAACATKPMGGIGSSGYTNGNIETGDMAISSAPAAAKPYFPEPLDGNQAVDFVADPAMREERLLRAPDVLPGLHIPQFKYDEMQGRMLAEDNRNIVLLNSDMMEQCAVIESFWKATRFIMTRWGLDGSRMKSAAAEAGCVGFEGLSRGIEQIVSTFMAGQTDQKIVGKQIADIVDQNFVFVNSTSKETSKFEPGAFGVATPAFTIVPSCGPTAGKRSTKEPGFTASRNLDEVSVPVLLQRVGQLTHVLRKAMADCDMCLENFLTSRSGARGKASANRIRQGLDDFENRIRNYLSSTPTDKMPSSVGNMARLLYYFVANREGSVEVQALSDFGFEMLDIYAEASVQLSPVRTSVARFVRTHLKCANAFSDRDGGAGRAAHRMLTFNEQAIDSFEAPATVAFRELAPGRSRLSNTRSKQEVPVPGSVSPAVQELQDNYAPSPVQTATRPTEGELMERMHPLEQRLHPDTQTVVGMNILEGGIPASGQPAVVVANGTDPRAVDRPPVSLISQAQANSALQSGDGNAAVVNVDLGRLFAASGLNGPGFGAPPSFNSGGVPVPPTAGAFGAGDDNVSSAGSLNDAADIFDPSESGAAPGRDFVELPAISGYECRDDIGGFYRDYLSFYLPKITCPLLLQLKGCTPQPDDPLGVLPFSMLIYACPYTWMNVCQSLVSAQGLAQAFRSLYPAHDDFYHERDFSGALSSSNQAGEGAYLNGVMNATAPTQSNGQSVGTSLIPNTSNDYTNGISDWSPDSATYLSNFLTQMPNSSPYQPLQNCIHSSLIVRQQQQDQEGEADAMSVANEKDDEANEFAKEGSAAPVASISIAVLSVIIYCSI